MRGPPRWWALDSTCRVHLHFRTPPASCPMALCQTMSTRIYARPSWRTQTRNWQGCRTPPLCSSSTTNGFLVGAKNNAGNSTVKKSGEHWTASTSKDGSVSIQVANSNASQLEKWVGWGSSHIDSNGSKFGFYRSCNVLKQGFQWLLSHHAQKGIQVGFTQHRCPRPTGRF